MSETMNRYVRTVLERALNGPGKADTTARRAAFANAGVDKRARSLIAKVARRAADVTDADVAAVKAAGVSEDEIFELVVCAALGQATRQLDTALAAVRTATQPADGPGARRDSREQEPRGGRDEA